MPSNDVADERNTESQEVSPVESPKRLKTYQIENESWRQYLPRTIVLGLLSVFPSIAFGAIFTHIGYGPTVYRFLTEFILYARLVGYGGLLVLVLLYVSDASYWTGCFVYIRGVFLFIAALAITTGGVLMAKEMPAAPLLIFLLSCPGYYGLLRKTCFPERRVMLPFYLSSLAIALFIHGTVGVGIWVWWVLSKQWFWPGKNDRVKVIFYEFMDCPLPPNINSTSVLHLSESPGLESCQAAFLMWAGLLIASCAVLTFSAILFFLGKSMLTKSSRKIGGKIRIFSTMILLAIAGMWTAGSIAGSSLYMSNLVMTFSFAFLVCIVITIGGTFGLQASRQEFLRSNFSKRLFWAMRSDWVKAMLVFGFPFFCIYLLVSLLNQFFRKYLTPCTTRHLNASEKMANWRSFWLTTVTHRQYESVRKWPWTSVLNKVQFLGLAYFFFSVVVGKATYVGLSELNVFLQNYDLWLVTIVFFTVGLMMFLNPAIPGVPVYLVGGVLLVGSSEKIFGFWLGCAYTSVVCFFIKLSAVYMQQRCFGEGLGNKVWVRRFVGVNSVSIRAIKIILQKPGLSLAKVSILCGGPDWPTSVLTGILKLSPLQMQIGTLPIMCLVAPCVFAGAFMLKQSEGEIYKSMSTVALALASGSQSLALLAAFYYIEKTVTKNRTMLEDMKPDEEVLRADEKAAKLQLIVRQQTRWEFVPTWLKLIQLTGTFMTICYCTMFGFRSSMCFEDYEMTDSVDSKLGGNPLNVVKGYIGWVSIGMAFGSMVTYKIFGCWSSRKVRRILMVQKTQVVPELGNGVKIEDDIPTGPKGRPV